MTVTQYILHHKGVKFLCVALFFCLTAFHTTSSDARNCIIDRGSVNVTFDVDYGKVKYNNGHSVLQISTKFGRHRSATSETIGLTKSALKTSLNTNIKYLRQNNKRVCAALSDVAFFVGYDLFRVYIARRHKPGSCQYRATLRHENTHVKIQQSALKKYAPRLKRRLRQLADRLPTYEANSPETALRHFNSSLVRDIQPALNEMNREMDRANAKIDTPTNYRREQALCPKIRQ